MKKIHEYQHGLEIIEGLMGSGKTYFAVKRVLRVIREDRRVVYTNLPLKLRIVRKRLRNLGGEELANLIQPLTEEHWRRYLRRHRAYAKLREEYVTQYTDQVSTEELKQISEATGKSISKLLNETIRPPESTARIHQRRKLHSNELRAWFEQQNGVNVYEGPDANEIPPYAVIVIDEVQNWHSMIDQSKDPDRVNLLDYITKSRHSVHWVWVITQDARNISIEFRRLAGSIWKVWQLGDSKIAWGMKFKHFGIRATAYKRYTHEQWEQKDKFGDESAESFVIITGLPWNRRNYRYYHPYTNSGSKRQLERQLRKARAEAGLDEEGKTEDEQMKNQIKNIGIMQRIASYIAGKIKLLALVGVAFAMGISFAKTPEKKDSNNAEQTREAVYPEQWPKWTIAGTQPWIGGKKYATGDYLPNGAEFVYADGDGGSIVLAHVGAFWLWEYGDEHPQRIAAIEDVRNAVAASRDQETTQSASVENGAQRLHDGMGTTEGDGTGELVAD